MTPTHRPPRRTPVTSWTRAVRAQVTAQKNPRPKIRINAARRARREVNETKLHIVKHQRRRGRGHCGRWRCRERSQQNQLHIVNRQRRRRSRRERRRRKRRRRAQRLLQLPEDLDGQRVVGPEDAPRPLALFHENGDGLEDVQVLRRSRSRCVCRHGRLFEDRRREDGKVEP